MKLRFTKMHGAGNDFVIIDCRRAPLALDAAQIARLGDRHFGVGFDQLLTIEPARDPSCAFSYGIYNADGSLARQCGNGLRCVAAWLHRAGAIGAGELQLESPSGPVGITVGDDGIVRAGMGQARFAPDDIPLRLPQADPYRLRVDGFGAEFGAVSMGNPHAVLTVTSVASAPVDRLGPAIERHPRFPKRVNVGFMEIVDRTHIRLRVFERGASETLACGTGACAAVAVGRRHGRLDSTVEVELAGGKLEITWSAPGEHIWMKGPTAVSFTGRAEF